MSAWLWVPNPWLGLDAVFINDPQRAEMHVLGIVIVRKRKAVPGIQPAVLRVAALGRGAHGQHRARRLVPWVVQRPPAVD